MFAMKAREKSAKTHTNFLDFNFSASQFPCSKHPQYSSTVGICPHCLKDRLMKLVCSDCGEHRVYSCSCSEEISSYRNSCSNVDVGSVGRVSFLIDNDKVDRKQRSFLRRISSSNCVEAERSNGFWRIKKLFSKRKSKGRGEENSNLDFSDKNGEMMMMSGYLEARKSGFLREILDDDEDGMKRNGFEVDRICSVFPIKERDYIEFKLDSWCESSKQDLCGGRSSKASENLEVGEIVEGLKRNGICGNGGSCRITMNERGGLKKVWKWIFSKEK